MKIKTIKGFDALRAISIILVLLTHLGMHAWIPESDFWTLRIWPLISGLTGVQIFFALSGFLITTILLNEKQRTGRIQLVFFYGKRFLRLAPALLVFYVMLIGAMVLHYLPENRTGIMYSVFYIYNYIPNYYYSSELGHMWSLAVEEQFYFLWPIVLSKIVDTKWLLMFIGMIILFCIVATYILPHWVIRFHNHEVNLQQRFKTERWLIPAVAPIMISSLFALLLFRWERFKILVQMHRKPVLVLAMVFFGASLYLPQPIIQVAFIFQAAGTAMFLCWINCNQHAQLVQLLDNRVLNYIGKISYGIYIYQGFFLTTGKNGTMAVQRFPVNLLLTLILAVISYEFFEKRVLAFKRYLS